MSFLVRHPVDRWTTVRGGLGKDLCDSLVIHWNHLSRQTRVRKPNDPIYECFLLSAN